jgi:hypothetical protein
VVQDRRIKPLCHLSVPQKPQPSAPPEISNAFYERAELRRISIPYRLVDHRTAKKREAPKGDVRQPCEYCKELVPKPGLKFCGRVCYLRHSVEVRQPIKLAQARLAKMRAEGFSPGHGGEAAKIRGAALAKTNKRFALHLTPEEMRARRAAQQREYRKRQKRNVGRQRG